MFNSVKTDQNDPVSLIQQYLANFEYFNATVLAEDLHLQHNSEKSKGILADCYLSQLEYQKAYSLLQESSSPLNLYKFAVACVRLNKLTEAEDALLRQPVIPHGVHGIELLGTVFRKQGRLEEAKERYEEAIKKNPRLLAKKKDQLEKLNEEIKKRKSNGNEEGLFGGNNSTGAQIRRTNLFEQVSAPETEKKSSKGYPIIDKLFDEKDCEICTGPDGKLYSKFLNLKNVNPLNNKFYIVQILESINNRGAYYFWSRWGRVGVQGQTQKIKTDSLEEAIKLFEEKVHEKCVKADYFECDLFEA